MGDMSADGYKMNNHGSDLDGDERPLFQRAEAGQLEFVLTELDTAITFCEVALATEKSSTKERNIGNAAKAYQNAQYFSQTPRHDLSGDGRYQGKLERLKKLLHELGQEI